MQTDSRAVSTSSMTANSDSVRARPITAEDAVYRVVTVGAILMLLGSLWIF